MCNLKFSSGKRFNNIFQLCLIKLSLFDVFVIQIKIVLDSGKQNFTCNRFLQIINHVHFKTFTFRHFICHSGKKYNRNPFKFIIALKFSEYFITIHTIHGYIK